MTNIKLWPEVYKVYPPVLATTYHPKAYDHSLTFGAGIVLMVLDRKAWEWCHMTVPYNLDMEVATDPRC
jgi:hypothetical protein